MRWRGLSRFAVALALAAGLWCTPFTAGHAAPVTQNFSLTANADSVSGRAGTSFIGTTATGSFTYDDAFLTGGDEVLSPGAGLTSVLLSVFGENFSETNDLNWDAFPMLGFSAFLPTTLSLRLEAGFNGVAFPSTLVLAVEAFELLAASGAGGDLTGPLYVETPLPATLGLLVLGLTGFGVLRRRLLRAAWPCPTLAGSRP